MHPDWEVTVLLRGFSSLGPGPGAGRHQCLNLKKPAGHPVSPAPRAGPAGGLVAAGPRALKPGRAVAGPKLEGHGPKDAKTTAKI